MPGQIPDMQVGISVQTFAQYQLVQKMSMVRDVFLNQQRKMQTRWNDFLLSIIATKTSSISKLAKWSQ